VIELTAHIFPYSNAGYNLSFTLEGEILQKLQSIMPKKQAQELFVKLCTPVEPTLLVRYRHDIRKIIDEVAELKTVTSQADLMQILQTNTRFKEMILNLERRYYFLTAINADARTAESMLPDILAEIIHPADDEDIEIPAIVAEEIYVIKNIMYFKDECSTYLIPYICFALRKQWDKLADVVGLTYTDMHQLTPAEVFELAHTPRNVKALVSERRAATLIIHEAYKSMAVQQGREAEDTYAAMQAAMPKIEVTDVTEFQGKVGCSGNGVGKVQIIRTSDEIKSFQEGNVLVAVYTAPEFVPAMQKAVAIITDTGGITSHAAIVARELRKPCVVGTKIATHVLKDGDVVEVDADKGIVRKIEADGND